MKKIFAMLTLGTFIFSMMGNSFVFAGEKFVGKNITKNNIQVADQVQELFKTYFNKKDYGYFKYKPNLKYNPIVEKQLEILIRKTYPQYKKYYNSLVNYEKPKNVDEFIKIIPKAEHIQFSSIIFNRRNISENLLESSFKVDYYDHNYYNNFLGAVDQVIKRFKRQNGYYPSLEELKNEKIYLNREEKKLGDYIDKIDYKVIYNTKKNNNDFGWRVSSVINKDENKIYEDLKMIIKLQNEELKKEMEKDLEDIKNKKLTHDQAKNLLKKYTKYSETSSNRDFDTMRGYIIKKYFLNTDYKLDYAKKTYTYKQALKELEKDKKFNIEKKDYKKLIKKEPKNIPEIYKKIPKDAIFFHIKNPQFLFKFLEDKKNKNSGLGIVNQIKNMIIQRVGAENWNDVKSNLNHEVILILSDLDLVSPNFLLILDKKDRGILMPGEKIMAAKSVGDKIYISYSKELLNKYLDLNEKDSIYYADDFRYVWSKKQNLKKDIFFFAGDSFFEKITSLKYFIKMKRKVNDYVNLQTLQDYVYALQKIKGEKINSFDELKKIVPLKDELLSKYTVHNSVVKNKNIGTLDDVKNISEINYDINKISLKELESYKTNILGYRQIWQSTLDPLGIVISEKDSGGYDIDFFLTPIPSFQQEELRIIGNLFKDFGKEDFGFIKNKKLRIGLFGIIHGFDADKLKKFLDEKVKYFMNKYKNGKKLTKEDRQIKYIVRDYLDINQFLFSKNKNREEIPQESILDYLDGEFILSFGGIDSSILDSWNPEKLDIILGVKFKSSLKAKEFMNILTNAFKKEKMHDRSVGGMIKKGLLKPISENYKKYSIYTIPMPYIKSLYYTIIEDSVYISVSKNSIKKSIDFAINPESSKSKFILNYLTGKKIFYAFLDANGVDKILSSIINKQDIEGLYLITREFNVGEIIGNLNIEFLSKKYFYNYEYAKVKGKKIKEIDIRVGILHLYSKNGNIFLSIDKSKSYILDDEKLKEKIYLKKEDIEKIKTFFTDKGENVIKLNNYDYSLKRKLYTIMSFMFIQNKDNIEELIPNNLVLSFGMGNDEIQLKMTSFVSNDKENETINNIKDNTKQESDKKQDKQNVLLYIIITILLTAGIGFIAFKKK